MSYSTASGQVNNVYYRKQKPQNTSTKAARAQRTVIRNTLKTALRNED